MRKKDIYIECEDCLIKYVFYDSGFSASLYGFPEREGSDFYVGDPNWIIVYKNKAYYRIEKDYIHYENK